MAQFYDMVFAGNVVLDEIHPFGAAVQTFCGGPVMFGAAAARCSQKRIAVVTKVAEDRLDCLDVLLDKAIALYVSLSRDTTRHQVVHLTENVDERDVSPGERRFLLWG